MKGYVNSLECRKAKKANVKVDQSMNLSHGRMSSACPSSDLSFRRRDMAMGRWHLEERPTGVDGVKGHPGMSQGGCSQCERNECWPCTT